MTVTGVRRGSIPAPEQTAETITGREGIDSAVAAVAAGAERWAATSAAQRARLLDRVIADTLTTADAWVADSAAAKGIAGYPAGEAEEWAGVWLVIRGLRLLSDALSDIALAGRPQLPGRPCVGPDGRLRVPVYPLSVYDRAVFPAVNAWVLLQPHVGDEDLQARQAWAYRRPYARAPVAAILGAGNHAVLGPRDVLYKLFVEGRVAVLKAHPVNDYMVPHWERAFAALIDQGALRIVTGGSADGAYLVNHPQVDEVHLTGSDKTFEAVVFGPGSDGAHRKAAGAPLLGKPITGQLGNVSPVIVVPGQWARDELEYQARHIASMLVNNAGSNCLTPQVLVTAEQWPQRQAFLDELARVLDQLPKRHAHCPGGAERHAAFMAAHPGAWLLGRPGPDGALPWTVVPDADPQAYDDICFTSEAFCGLIASAALRAADPAEFLDQATDFANETLWGTLAATILVDPRTRRHRDVTRALTRAVARLRYGTVAINIWHMFAFAATSATWGGYPGQPDDDIQSGRGVVTNALMLPDPEKTFVNAPFRARPTPVWFTTQPGILPMFQALPAFEANPTLPKLAALTRSAFRRSLGSTSRKPCV